MKTALANLTDTVTDWRFSPLHQRWQSQIDQAGRDVVFLVETNDIEQYGIPYIVKLFQLFVAKGQSKLVDYLLEIDCGPYPGWAMEAMQHGIKKIRWNADLKASLALTELAKSRGVSWTINPTHHPRTKGKIP